MELKNFIENILGINVNNIAYYETAFTHKSYLNEQENNILDSYERLEFLGDSILGASTAQLLFEKFPRANEGRLTAYRSSLVQTATLSKVSKTLGLGDFLVLGKGAESNNARESESLNAALFEALIGAIFLDSGYEKAREFSIENLKDFIESLPILESPKTFKSLLHELIQKHQGYRPEYRLIERSGSDNAPIFTVEVLVDNEVLGKGKGRRKALAEQRAAEDALTQISLGKVNIFENLKNPSSNQNSSRSETGIKIRTSAIISSETGKKDPVRFPMVVFQTLVKLKELFN